MFLKMLLYVTGLIDEAFVILIVPKDKFICLCSSFGRFIPFVVVFLKLKNWL